METRLTRFAASGLNYDFCSGEKYSSGQNFFSVFIGQNGSGKSRLLRELVLALTEGHKLKQQSITIAKRINNAIYQYDQSIDGVKVTTQGKTRLNKVHKNHVISFTASVTDKLPSKVDRKYCDYVYLGPMLYESIQKRTCHSLTSFLDDLTETDALKVKDRALPLFEFLDFTPKISVHWKVKQTSLNNLKDLQTQQRDFKRFVKDSEYHSLYRDDVLDELCQVYFSLLNWKKVKKNKTISLEFDFASTTAAFSKVTSDYSLYTKLSKLGLLETPRIGLHNRCGQEVPSIHLSSGESAIVTSLLRLVPIVKQGSLIFLDEPELSLHPKWQTVYIRVFDRIIAGLGCHVFLATHSNLLISDLPLNNSEVLHLSNSAKTWKRYTRTEGLSSEEILLDVFGLPTSRNHYLNIRLQRLLDLVTDNKTDSSEFSQLLEQIEAVRRNLRDEDPLKMVMDTLVGENEYGSD